MIALVLGSAAIADAQPKRFADDPTAGIALPATPLAGDQDATAIALNPAGLVFLGDWHVEFAITGLREAYAHAHGTGFGLYAATPLRLPLLPNVAFGAALEQLEPPRVTLVPDPGEPMRLSLTAAYEWTKQLGVGVAWRHFFAGGGGATNGVDTFDLGLAARLGRHWAAGAVVRDVFGPIVAGVPVERRYGAELVSRPLGTDRLELGLRGGIGERRADWDAALRVGWKISRGLYLRGEVALRTRFELTDLFDPTVTAEEREVVASLGFEVSLGRAGAAFYGTGSLDSDEHAHLLGGSFLARWSAERVPSVVSRGDRIERIMLKGTIGNRALTSILLRMRSLEKDGHVKAVFLTFDDLVVGWGIAQELREAIARLRAHGKPVFAYLLAGTTREYYVAAAANQIFLDRAGGVRLQGMVSTLLFFKDFFDKIGVVAQFEKIEEYKSAPEAFTMDASSETARKMHDALFDDVLAHVTADLAKDRNVPAASWLAVFDDGPYTAKEAADAHFVDAVGDPTELDAALAKALGGHRYDVSDGAPKERPDSWEYPQIAVIYIDGDIVDGKSRSIPLLGEELTGGDTIAAAIASARANDRVKAIVLRIDSPGGSAVASEVIAREVKATRGVKPILVSMGDIAASGGYFAAAYGERIYAEPSTITGSIGIFTGKFDLSGLLGGKLGLTWETTKRGAHADMETYLRPYTDEERATIKHKLRYYYEEFTGAVAGGRGMTMDAVDKVGRGHVWTGAQAMDKDVHLVDEFGNLVDAIEEAKRRAGLDVDERAELLMLPVPPSSFLAKLLELAGLHESESSSQPWTALPIAKDLLRLVPGSLVVAPADTPQARLPFVLID